VLAPRVVVLLLCCTVVSSAALIFGAVGAVHALG
jgi:hypothetical protein